MSPRSRRRSRARVQTLRRTLRRRLHALPAVGLLAVVVALAACSGSFDPTGPCTSDGSAAGAYPELEALVPHQFRGGAAAEVDSGRSCTTAGLGTLAGHGVTELRFAGATWKTGTDSGVSLATFTTPGSIALQPEWLTEFYETGARSGKNVDSVTTTAFPVSADVNGQRIDVLNGESFQSVVVWQRAGRVEVALVADFIREIQTKEAHDAVVRDAIEAWLGGGGTSSPVPASAESAPS